MSQALSTIESGPHEIIERVVLAGDLAKLTAADRLNYYTAVCRSLGLNELTRPFEYITLNGKLTLYARKDATDQLRNLREISITITSREKIEDVYVVTSRATTPGGRTDESTGAVYVGKLGGDALCNAMMKAETKSKRRVTLSICGLGMLDETEAATIPGAMIEGAPEQDEPSPSEDTDDAEIDGTLRQLWIAGGRKPDEFDAYHLKFIAKKTPAQRRQIAQSWEAALKQKTGDADATAPAGAAELSQPSGNGDDNGWQIPVRNAFTSSTCARS